MVVIELFSLSSLLTQFARNELERSGPRPAVVFLAREEDWKQLEAFESNTPVIQRTPTQTEGTSVEENTIVDVNDLLDILNAQIRRER